jgi:hypothetical protein
MTKHRKHRRTKRKSQRGGFLGFGSSESSGEPGMFSNAMSSVTGATSNIVSGSESYLQGMKDKSNSWFSGFSNPFSSSSSSSSSYPASDIPVSPASPTGEEIPVYNPDNTIGGRRRRKSRKMRGGKNNLGLTYYASPVSDAKVAEPTYWIKGGSRKRRRTRRHKRR